MLMNIKAIKFRRRREALTDYKKRFRLVKSGMDRIVIRKTNKRIIAHAVRYTEKGDQTLAYADSSELKAFNWPSNSNRGTAYLTGMLLARKLKEKGSSTEYILDIGITSPVKNSIPFVFAKGCADAGVKIRGTFDMDSNIYDYSNTKYIQEMKSKDAEAYKKQYSGLLEKKIEPEQMHKLFAEVKSRILK